MTLGAVGFTCLYFTSAEQDWTAVFAVCLFSPSPGGVGDHLSATTRTCINVQHSLGIQLLLHFKLQGQLGRNPCQSCQVRKRETNSPRRECGVKHRDKERKSRHESPGLCLRVWNQVMYRVFPPFAWFLSFFEPTVQHQELEKRWGESKFMSHDWTWCHPSVWGKILGWHYL